MKLPLHSSKTCAGRKLLYHDNFLSFYFSFLMVAFGVSFFWMSILQVVLWPLLLKMLVVEKYTGAVSTVYFHSSSLKYSEPVACNLNLYLGVIFSPRF